MAKSKLTMKPLDKIMYQKAKKTVSKQYGGSTGSTKYKLLVNKTYRRLGGKFGKK